MPVANASLSGDNLALYLQRKGTREITFVDVPLTGTLGSALWTSFGARGKYGAAYTADYWMNKIFQPLNLREVHSDRSIQTTDRETIYTLSVDIVATPCIITKDIQFSLHYNHPDAVPTGERSQSFDAIIKYLGGSTNGEPNVYPTASVQRYCNQADSATSDLFLGGEFPIQINAFTLGTSSGRDYLHQSNYFAQATPTSRLASPVQVYLNVGFPKDSPITINMARTLIAENEDIVKANEVVPQVFKTFSHAVKDPATGKFVCKEDYRTIVTSYTFMNAKLKNNSDNLQATYILQQWRGWNSQQSLTIYWELPLADYVNKILYNYTRTEYLTYTSGSTGYKPVQKLCP